MTLTVICLRQYFVLQEGNGKKSEKSMKIIHIKGKTLYIFWTNLGISMKLLERLWFMMIKRHTKTGFHLLSRKQIFGKTTGGRRSNWIPPPPTFFRVRILQHKTDYVEIFNLFELKFVSRHPIIVFKALLILCLWIHRMSLFIEKSDSQLSERRQTWPVANRVCLFCSQTESKLFKMLLKILGRYTKIIQIQIARA